MNNQSYLAFQWVSSHTLRRIINFFSQVEIDSCAARRDQGKESSSEPSAADLQAHSKRDTLSLSLPKRAASELLQNHW